MKALVVEKAANRSLQDLNFAKSRFLRQLNMKS